MKKRKNRLFALMVFFLAMTAFAVNFSDAVHIRLQFFLGAIPPHILEAVLMKYISPIRPGRKDTRKLTQKPSVSFTYRVA